MAEHVSSQSEESGVLCYWRTKYIHVYSMQLNCYIPSKVLYMNARYSCLHRGNTQFELTRNVSLFAQLQVAFYMLRIESFTHQIIWRC
jgi:hypothetical protein